MVSRAGIGGTSTTTSTRVASASVDPAGRARWGRELHYVLTGLPWGIVAFTVAVTGVVLGASTVVVWVGLPVLALTLSGCRLLGDVEHAAVRRALGRDLPARHHPVAEGGRIRRLLAVLRDPQAWRDLLHAVVALPVRILTSALALSWVAGAVGGLLHLAYAWALPDGSGLLRLVLGVRSWWGEVTLVTALGALLAVTAPAVVHGLAVVQAGLARMLLTDEGGALRERAEQLEGSRRAAVSAEAQTLRRLERDLHDGPQQRLVRLAMDLESVSRRLDDDPEAARSIVRGALDQSREALGELRALSRGIAPPVLADRGLGPALAAVAGRCPLPVSVRVDLPSGSRLPPEVENAAYFVVAEALTNVAKHSGATRATVDVAHRVGSVRVEVGDDGRGGAHPGKGHGLAGLADRLAALEGALAVSSPPGGPTTLIATIPAVGVGV
jgi:signal transduction histidine kinase